MKSVILYMPVVSVDNDGGVSLWYLLESTIIFKYKFCEVPIFVLSLHALLLQTIGILLV